MQRGLHQFPKQGEHAPWQNTQDYLLDRKILAKNLFADGVLQFRGDLEEARQTSAA
jgi:hypothetical protein